MLLLWAHLNLSLRGKTPNRLIRLFLWCFKFELLSCQSFSKCPRARILDFSDQTFIWQNSILAVHLQEINWTSLHFHRSEVQMDNNHSLLKSSFPFSFIFPEINLHCAWFFHQYKAEFLPWLLLLESLPLTYGNSIVIINSSIFL